MQDEGAHGDDVSPPFRDAKTDDIFKIALLQFVEKCVNVGVPERKVVNFQCIEMLQSLGDLRNCGQGSCNAIDMLSGGEKG